MKIIRTAMLALMLAACGQAWGDMEAGLAAYDAGDYGTALREWASLAEAGNAEAQYRLGVMYEKGLGTRPDYGQAMQWYTTAAEQGHAVAQYTLGMIAWTGYFGDMPDWRTAVKWFRKAAEQGMADAQYQTGLLYGFGPGGVSGNHREEAMWYRQAAEQGHALAQCRLGSLYFKGTGVPQDYVLAYMWFNLAAANGLDSAVSRRFDVAGLMTTGQIAEAQARTREQLGKPLKPQ